MSDGGHTEDRRQSADSTTPGSVSDNKAIGGGLPLLNVLQRDVIPLLASDRGIPMRGLRSAAASAVPERNPATAAQTAAQNSPTQYLQPLISALLAGASREARELIEQHASSQGTGHFIDCCEDLLVPAAQALGQLWSEDLADFHQVTLATGLLQQLLRGLPGDPIDGLPEMPPGALEPGTTHRILLLLASGEQHSIGLSMLGRAFADAGWLIDGGPGIDHAEALQRVADNHFDVIGVSIGGSVLVDGCREQLAELRERSANPDVPVLVGGPLLALEPELATLLGANASANDLRDALRIAAELTSTSAKAAASVQPA